MVWDARYHTPKGIIRKTAERRFELYLNDDCSTAEHAERAEDNLVLCGLCDPGGEIDRPAEHIMGMTP